MADLKDMFRIIMGFWEKHEALIGRVAINGARIEREINLLFAYVFNLEFEAWTILTRNISSIPRKVAVLRQGLNQEFCKIPSPDKKKLEDILQSITEFVAIRNDLIHGQLFPDFETINSSMTRFKSLDEQSLESFLVEVRKIVDDRISIPEFDTKSATVKYKIYSVSEVERKIDSAKSFVHGVQEVMESLKTQYDWVGMRMAKSELRKLEDLDAMDR
jgi:hypothetical protein